jgi:hypothetical protein
MYIGGLEKERAYLLFLMMKVQNYLLKKLEDHHRCHEIPENFIS